QLKRRYSHAPQIFCWSRLSSAGLRPARKSLLVPRRIVASATFLGLFGVWAFVCVLFFHASGVGSGVAGLAVAHVFGGFGGAGRGGGFGAGAGGGGASGVAVFAGAELVAGGHAAGGSRLAAGFA